jgi:hypothetical protein
MSPAAVPTSSLLLYTTEDGRTRIQCRLEDDTLWLTQAQMAELFQTTPQNITLHLKDIYAEGELMEEATCKEYLQVRREGQRDVTRSLRHYRLEAILAVGFRVRSHRGTQFRRWATERLNEYLVKGFVMDDERLRNPPGPGQPDYFDELLDRIRDIRASERRFYQKITDIYAQCSVDYDPGADLTKTFYATVQNKLHWAIHGHTAAELIHQRADATQPNMGLTTWKNAPSGPIRKADVTIAKNYLGEEELRELNRVVTMYLDYAEDQARRRHAMTMADWIHKLDAFLQFNERNVLAHAGTITHDLATEHAEAQFDQYQDQRRALEASQPVSDFDRVVEQTKQLEGRKRNRGDA